ncbi:50S ribosomal protein L2 [Candidatus Woesearchaeota archaeon]|nr:50S ribosomal protein L2 [Candidatus Woesearchaeota archaeon]
MGKNLVQQRRGRGSPTYRSASFKFEGAVKLYDGEGAGQVVELVHCAGHSSPLMRVAFNSATNLNSTLAFAPDGIKVGDIVQAGQDAQVSAGNILLLKDIPEGTLIHNIELRPGDGGKLVRASGAFARIVSRGQEGVRVLLPSRKEKLFLPTCRAAVGALAGAGRPDKPFLKAGNRYKKMRARNKLYPKVCGISMNAVDHPFGGKCSHIKGRPTQSPRGAPPGRKVGKIAPRRTGRKK